MNTKDILTLFEYNSWANARILNAAARLTNEQFIAPGGLSFGGVRGTLVHAFGAEYLWRKRMQEGVSPSAMPPESQYADLAGLGALWETEASLMRAYIESLTDNTLQQTFTYKNLKGIQYETVIWQALAHLANHGTQHRAEVAVLLTDFGQSPGDVDMILFFREKGSK